MKLLFFSHSKVAISEISFSRSSKYLRKLTQEVYKLKSSSLSEPATLYRISSLFLKACLNIFFIHKIENEKF